MQTTSKPWYREPWPWFLIMLPMSAVIASVATIWLAIKSQDGLVADDYYKQGMAINKTLQRDETAQQLGLHAEISLDDSLLRIQLSAKPAVNPDSLLLHLVHPTQPGRDHHLVLQKSEAGVYLVVIKDKSIEDGLRSQRWQVILEAPESDWRLTGLWSIGSSVIHLGV